MFKKDDILQNLNPEQKAAVTHGQGPLLIVAGAGTGKTRVIAHRIGHLIAAKQARPEQILALTFTEKAAAEMEERIDLMLPYGYANVWIGTFHAFGERMLREHALELGLASDFQVLPEAEQAIFFKEHLFEYSLDYYRPLGNPTKFIGAMLKVISRAKDEDVSAGEYAAWAAGLEVAAGSNPEDPELTEEARRQAEIAGCYTIHQRLMAEGGKVDFGDLVVLALKLLRDHPLIRKEYAGRFKYILVDEFQDTNYAQFQLLRLLAEDHRNITVVGDDDQSIYKFRGAAISNILSFLDVYPGAKQLVLTKNYRSTQAILDTAYRLISHNNPDRLEIRNDIDKRLSALEPGGTPVRHLHYDTLTSEADAVAALIREGVDGERFTYKDVAVLVRTNGEAEPFLRSLNMKSIPYVFSGSRGLYSREEVRLLLSFLRCISDFSDSLSLYHLAGSEIFGMNGRDLGRCMTVARRQNRTLRYVFEHADDFPELKELSKGGRAAMGTVMKTIDTFVERSRDVGTGVLLYQFLSESGFLRHLTHAGTVEAESRIRNIARFFETVSHFATLAVEDRADRFVEHIDLLIEAGDDPASAESIPDTDAVHVLTVHKAKGLEFPVVIMVGLVDGRFPHGERRESIPLPDGLIKEPVPGGDIHLQEERRLFYVGMTRAKKELYLTSGRDYGGVRGRKVSRFVLEALDKPRADEDYLRSSALEAIERNAPPPGETAPDEAGPVADDHLLQLSQKKIDDYLTCPLKYKYIHILRVPLLPFHTVVYGRAIHEAVKVYHTQKKKGKAVALKDLISVFESSWMSEGFISREHEERRLEAGRQALEQFYTDQEASGIIPTYVEEEFAFRLENNKIIGRWDRVDVRDEEVVIIDFKSSEVRKQAAADKRVRESLQMDIYALAYREMHGVLPDRVELHFLETGLVGSARPTKKRLAKAVESIQQAAAGIRAADYTAAPDFNACSYCPYENICPLR